MVCLYFACLFVLTSYFTLVSALDYVSPVPQLPVFAFTNHSVICSSVSIHLVTCVLFALLKFSILICMILDFVNSH